MFELHVPWWELVVRAAAVYVVLLVLIRLSGKRTVGQFTPFDLLVMVLLSEGVSNAMLAGDESLLGGFIIASTLLGLNAIFSRVAARSKRARWLTEGDPVVVGRDGQIFKDRLVKEHVSEDDLMQALRESDCELQDMRLAFLEADGKFSILKQRK
jgi:uncharacterized membrane protein YcaP (DUF421 family)